MRAAVMGLGSWGTAFGMVLADAGNDVGNGCNNVCRPHQAEVGGCFIQ